MSPIGAAAAPARRLAAPLRREAILEAAGQLFGERGYAATRLDDVARAMGVTKPIVYRHFESKRELYLALLRRHEADLPSFFAAIEPDSARTPAGLITAVLDRWLDYVAERSYAWRILFRDTTGDERIEHVRRGVSLRAREVLADFIRTSAPSVPPGQVMPTAEFLSSGLAGLVLWWIDNPDVPKDLIHASAVRLTVSILAP